MIYSNWRFLTDAMTMIVAAVNVAISGLVFRRQLQNSAKRDVVVLIKRVDDIEKKIIAMPSQADIQNLTFRLGSVEAAVGNTREELAANTEATKAVGALVQLLVTHQLNKEKNA